MKTLVISISLALGVSLAFGQEKKSMVIGTMIDRPNAILVINPPNSDQGLLLPQLTGKQREDMTPSSPEDDGLVVFDIWDNSFYHWNTGQWVRGLGGSSDASLTYNPTTQVLSLSNGNQVSLATLKEVPSPAGNAGKFLASDGTSLTWATAESLGDITGIITSSTSALSVAGTSGDVTLSVNTDGTSVSVNGSNQLQISNSGVTAAKISPSAVNSSHIVDGTVTGTDIQDNTITGSDLANGVVTSLKIANGAVATNNILSGGNNKVLTTGATGIVGWTDQSLLSSDNQNLTLSSNSLNIEDGTGVTLDNLTLSGQVGGTLGTTTIQPNTITSANIVDGSVSTQDIASGGSDQVLTTNGLGTVAWVNRLTFADDNQTLSLAGSSLSIQDGNSVTLSGAGQVSGPLDALAISPGAANEILTTSGAGTDAQWLPAGGDIAGPINNIKVTRLQGRDVAANAPNVGDAMVWNGTSWTPLPTAGTATVQNLSIDPSDFAGAIPSGSKDEGVGLLEGNEGQFVYAGSQTRTLIAPVHLPDGAVLQSMTLYYEYTLLLGILGPLNVELVRKPLTGGASQVLGTIAPLLSIGVSTNSTGLAHTVDNSTSSYRIIATFRNSGDADQASEALQRIYGLRIQFLK